MRLKEERWPLSVGVWAVASGRVHGAERQGQRGQVGHKANVGEPRHRGHRTNPGGRAGGEGDRPVVCGARRPGAVSILEGVAASPRCRGQSSGVGEDRQTAEPETRPTIPDTLFK